MTKSLLMTYNFKISDLILCLKMKWCWYVSHPIFVLPAS